MQLHSMVIDDFLSDFGAARTWADGAQYGPVTNPVDGVEYPGICADIPEAIRSEVHLKLQVILGGRVDIKTMFTRLSTAGVHVPHQAHNDASMGMMSLMLYLNRPEHCCGGTEVVRHFRLGMDYGPADDSELSEWRQSTNCQSCWEVASECEMKANRAFIFDARLMHRAAPIGGFGSDEKDGRLVLTAFFDLPA